MSDLTGDGARVELGKGVFLQAPGITGTAQLIPSKTDSRGGTQRHLDPMFEDVLGSAGLRDHRSTVLNVNSASRGLSASRKGRGKRPALATYEVPAPAKNQRAVLLISDDNGVSTWHFPDTSTSRTRAARGPRTLTFTIPASRLAIPSDDFRPSGRGILGGIARMVLRCLVYPVAEKLIGLAAKEVARLWEDHAHPYMLSRFAAPAGGAANPSWVPLSAAGIQALNGKRVLLAIHGIFSSVRGSFGDIDPHTWQALTTRYDAVLGFDHPTVGTDPIENVRTLLGLIPHGTQLQVDILSHSRGGLVGRILAGELTGPTGGPLSNLDAVSVRKIVFVGTPNQGTVLVEPDNLGHLVDRFTSMLRIAPPGPWSGVTTITSAVLEIVKIIGMGAEGGLPGLACMTPTSELITALNAPPRASYTPYAVSTDFEPTGGLRWLFLDAGTDLVFGGTSNDVAVPTAGISEAPDPNFPVPAADLLPLGSSSTWHCSYFERVDVKTRLLEWLTGT